MYLLENGADIMLETSFLIINRPITDDEIAIEEEKLNFIKYLIEEVPYREYYFKHYSYDLNLFGYAVQCNHWLIVDYLMEKNLFNIDDFVSDDNKTALIVAVEKACETKSYNTCRILIEKGADKSISDSFGKTALDYALEYKDLILIEMLSE